MSRFAALALAASLVVFGSLSAEAGYTEITYDLTGSSLTINVPIAGSAPVIGQMTLAFNDAASASKPIQPSATVMIKTMFLSANPLVIGFVTGWFTNTMIPGAYAGPGHLTQTPYGGVIAVGTSLGGPFGGAYMKGQIHCILAAPYCTVLAGMPASVTIPLTPPYGTPSPVVFGLFNLDPGHILNHNNLTLTAARPVRLGSQSQTTGTMFLVGTEIGRFHIPEPTSLSLILLGALGLGGTAVVARRRRA